MFVPGSRLTGREPAAWRTSRGAVGSRNAVEAAAAIKGGKKVEETPFMEKMFHTNLLSFTFTMKTLQL